MLTENLHRNRALTGNHVLVVIRRDERKLALLHETRRLFSGIGIAVSCKNNLRTVTLDRIHLDVRGRDRHHDSRLAPKPFRREGDALCVVSGGRGKDALRKRLCGQLGHLVVGAANLERMDRLQVLSFQEELRAELP